MALAQPRLRPDNVDEVLKAMTLEEKATLLVGAAQAKVVNGVPTGEAPKVQGAAGATAEIERLGIPMTILADGPAGIRIEPIRPGDDKTYYATAFPVGTLLASSWDVDLVRKVTEAMGNEVLEYGADVLLAPGMNIHRNPLCGRNFEYFSEDPLLSGKIASAYVQGIQSNGVGVSIKHFAVNNQEQNREWGDSRVGERALREIYLKNFEICVRESNPWTVMSSYNKLNGIFTQQNYGLLTNILRHDWGFSGIVMTDWGCKVGTVDAVKAGNDLMEPGAPIEIQRIIDAVNSGEISTDELDRNVHNILQYIVKTPSFKGYKYSNAPDLKAHAEIARRAAANSMILLRNMDNTLPFKGSEKVALFGISSIDFVSGGTGSGDVNEEYTVNMEQALLGAGFSIDEELSQYYHRCYDKAHAQKDLVTGDDPVSKMIMWFNGSKIPEVELPEDCLGFLADRNDVALVVLGRNAGEGSDRKLRDDFELTSVESALLTRVSNAFRAVGKKVVVVLNIGGVIETASWKNRADAILLPWSPGQEGANAVTDVLLGKVNPSGKLPMTFPISYFDVPSATNFPYGKEVNETPNPWAPKKVRENIDYTDYDEGIYVGYRHYTTNNIEVSYPFGYGMSYTTFEYSKPMVKVAAEGITATITVTNTGSVAGREAVQLYVSAPAGGLDKPKMELRSFAKTALLAPGESQSLSMNFTPYDLASFNEASNAFETASGAYTAFFAASADDIREKAAFKIAKASSYPVWTDSSK